MNTILISGFGEFEPLFTHRALEALYRETGTTPATFEPDSMENMDALLYHSLTADAARQGAVVTREGFRQCLDDMTGVEYMRLVRKAAAAYKEAFADEEEPEEEKNV